MKKPTAIHHAKEAYRLWLTHGIKSKGFSITDDTQWPYRFAANGWVIRLNSKGTKAWGYAATEPEDFQ